MKRLERETLTRLRDQMASFGWSDAELDELIDPKLGVITALQDLLDDLERMRRTDLGFIPPNEPLQGGPKG